MIDARIRRVALALLLSPALVVLLVGLDARARRSARAADEPALLRVLPRLPSGDLALSGGARWLRMPSLEEPHAAFADGPASADPDPAGGAMAPPVEVWSAIKARSNPKGMP